MVTTSSKPSLCHSFPKLVPNIIKYRTWNSKFIFATLFYADRRIKDEELLNCEYKQRYWENIFFFKL